MPPRPTTTHPTTTHPTTTHPTAPRPTSRRMLAALSGVSLALAFAAGAVWAASCFVAPYVRWLTAGGPDRTPNRTVIAAGGGRAVVRTAWFPTGVRARPRLEAGLDQPVPTLDGVPAARRWLGFEHAHEAYAGMEMVTVVAPLWAVTGALAVLPAARRGRRYRRDRWAARTPHPSV